eukprot:Sspe_Gene.966::Locus_329_Transcript_2_2_Confidence_0.750_Length_1198::g.966::m.966
MQSCKAAVPFRAFSTTPKNRYAPSYKRAELTSNAYSSLKLDLAKNTLGEFFYRAGVQPQLNHDELGRGYIDGSNLDVALRSNQTAIPCEVLGELLGRTNLRTERVFVEEWVEWCKITMHRLLAQQLDDEVIRGVCQASTHPVLGRYLKAVKPIQAHEVILPLDGVVMLEANTWTVQVSQKSHLLAVGGPQLAAHSCNPTMYIEFDYANPRVYCGMPEDEVLPAVAFRAVRDIEEGEMLTFDYNTTEWAITDRFHDNDTGRYVAGFSRIDASDAEYRAAVLPYLTKPIIELATQHGLLTDEEKAIAGTLCCKGTA